MSEIVFKKKTTKAKIRKRTTSLDTEDEPSSLGTSANESSNTDQTQDEQEQDTSSILGDFKLLRKLRTKSRGVDASDLEKGDAETRRRRKLEKEKEKEEDDDPWKMKTGGLVDLDEVKEKEGTSFMASFTGRNQTLDVNKHLETYIETELKKKRGVTVEEQISPEEDKSKSLEDDLYKLPDHLKVEKKAVNEGNVTLSASMLTAIPEVDLGIDTKIKNIEATQRAKRQILNTALTHARPDPSKQTFSQNRWIIPHSSLPSSDLNSLAKSLQSDSRGDNVGVVTNDGKLLSEIKKDRISEEEREKKRLYWEQQKEKRMMATDEIVFERFKKKMRR